MGLKGVYSTLACLGGVRPISKVQEKKFGKTPAGFEECGNGLPPGVARPHRTEAPEFSAKKILREHRKPSLPGEGMKILVQKTFRMAKGGC